MSEFVDIVPPPAREREYQPFSGDLRRSIVLLGVSGSGKSEVGRYLADVTSLPFIDADAVVAERMGMSFHQGVISNLDALEAMQAEVTAELLSVLGDSSAPVRVVALAPSPSVSDHVLESLSSLSAAGVYVVELVADVSEVSRRLGLNAPRSVALGAPRAMLTKMIHQTRLQHQRVANVSVNTVGRSIGDIGQEILASL